MSENKLESIGAEIIKSLTEKQLTDFLNQIFSLLNKEEIDEIVLPLDEDISKTVLELTYPKNEEGKTSKYIPSNAKCLELWNSLWGDWRNVISLIGNVEGPYFCCENHWEPPCFFKRTFIICF